MARLRIKTKRTRLTISTRHAIRVGPFHGSYTERHSCHEHTSEARLGCRAVLRRRLSVRYGHGCNPCLPAPARREPCRYRLVGPGWLPWTLKFLWAPAVDVWGHRRTWVWVCQALMCLPLVILAGSHAQEGIWILWSVLILFAILSATQDIAIDAYTIELLEKHEMGVANGVRVTAYRIALIAAGGLVVAAAGLMGWGVVFIGAALLMGLLSVVSARAPLADATTSTAQPG